MTRSMLDDAFAHDAWATDRLIDTCAALTPEQLQAPAPGTYGPIIATLRHLVASECWYLSFFREGSPRIDEDDDVNLDTLRSIAAGNGAAWVDVLAQHPDPDRDIVEIDDGWEVHSPVGVRLAQVIHHGTDHRSQICTALTSLGVQPPDIDVWAYARASGRERGVEVPPTGS